MIYLKASGASKEPDEIQCSMAMLPHVVGDDALE